jgi:glycosyltransferase involved in cell wall biosynthesis
VWEYPPALVGGLGTYADYITREFVRLGHDVTVFTLNPGDLKTREVFRGVEIHTRARIAWGIKKSLKDPEEAKLWGENGRKHVLKYFTWRKAAEQTIEIYKLTQKNLEAQMADVKPSMQLVKKS